MRRHFPWYFVGLLFSVLLSCSGKDKKAPAAETSTTKDSIVKAPPGNNEPVTTAADSSLTEAERSAMRKGLDKWTKSFRNFNIDSFLFSQKTAFPDIDYGEAPNAGFFDLYKASLSYSPDSSQFIDLYSAGLMLEKKGKKIIASSDVDNAVTLFDQSNKTWKRIAFFGPSAWIEEVVWTSPATFILAGVGPSDDVDESTAFLLLGDTKEKTFRWFKSKATRAQSAKYEASGIKKLKIDEWE